jgi:hypothetical protein
VINTNVGTNGGRGKTVDVECECLRDEKGLISAREVITYLHYSLYMFSKFKFKLTCVRSYRD